MKTLVTFIVASDIKSPLKRFLRVKQYHAFRVAEDVLELRKRATVLPYTYIAHSVFRN